MNKAYALILLCLPIFLFPQENNEKGLLQIDLVVKVVSAESEELWSVNLTKYTINSRSISINLKGFDGELKATMTPLLIDNEFILLKAESIVKSLETGEVINESHIELTTRINEKIILFPIGNLKNAPNVIMELYITKHNGVGV